VLHNAIIQLSKYIWALTSFGGVPSTEGFTKRYEPHYHLRKIEVDGVEVQGQYGCLNFHVKHGNQRSKLTVSVKNKWSGLGPRRGFIVRYLLCDALALDVVKEYSLFTLI
jgi:hypothetical protein